MTNTLVATDYKDPPIVNDENAMDYIVRRLTPTECKGSRDFPTGGVMISVRKTQLMKIFRTGLRYLKRTESLLELQKPERKIR